MPTSRAKIPFAIFFLERSGSSHLCSLLDSHPQIRCGAEEFTTRRLPETSPHEAPRYIHSRQLKLLEPNDDQSVAHLNNIFLRNEHASGFKLKYPIQFNRYPEIVDSLLAAKDSVRVIHLDRKNVLKKFVSKQVLVQQRSNDPDFRRSESVEFKPVHIKLDSMLETLARFESQRRELKELAKPFEHSMTIEYERFNNDHQTLVNEILQFLAVDPDCKLASKFQKKTPQSMQESVANYGEMARLVTGTPFERMLDRV